MNQAVSLWQFKPGEALMIALIVIIYAVGIIGMSIPSSKELFKQLIPVVIILSLAASLAFHKNLYNFKTIIVFLAIVLASWAIEAAGVSTGKIFGRYSYGHALGIQLIETPLIIGFNWLLLVYCSASIIHSVSRRPLLNIVVASLLMVIYDLVLEHVAPSLSMWQFEGGIAPLSNYIAWFVIALIFQSLLYASRIRIVNRVAPVVFTIQFLFFSVILLISFFRS